MSFFTNLVEIVLKQSVCKNDFKTATIEWDVISFKEESGSFCTCGKNPIKDVFIIENKHNNKTLEIGNECIKHFKADYGWVFPQVKRIRKGLTPNLKFLTYLEDNKKINFFEYKFMVNMRNKKKLSIKQKELHKKIIEKINKLI